jgi:hypothetical protein
MSQSTVLTLNKTRVGEIHWEATKHSPCGGDGDMAEKARQLDGRWAGKPHDSQVSTYSVSRRLGECLAVSQEGEE